MFADLLGHPQKEWIINMKRLVEKRRQHGDSYGGQNEFRRQIFHVFPSRVQQTALVLNQRNNCDERGTDFQSVGRSGVSPDLFNSAGWKPTGPTGKMPVPRELKATRAGVQVTPISLRSVIGVVLVN